VPPPAPELELELLDVVVPDVVLVVELLVSLLPQPAAPAVAASAEPRMKTRFIFIRDSSEFPCHAASGQDGPARSHGRATPRLGHTREAGEVGLGKGRNRPESHVHDDAAGASRYDASREAALLSKHIATRRRAAARDACRVRRAEAD
jgi:hypothetical protein